MLRKRYAIIAISIFALGVVFGIGMSKFDTVLFCAIFAVLFALSIASFAIIAVKDNKKAYKVISAAAFAVAMFSAGVLWLTTYTLCNNENKEFSDMTDNVTLEIKEVNLGSLDAKIISSEIGVDKGEIIRFYPEEMPSNALAGDVVYANVTYKYRNTQSYLSKDISLSATGNINSVSDGKGLVYSIRKSVYENSEILFGDFEYAKEISRGVTVGDSEGISSYVYSVYQSSGISHLLAISGLHITLIVMGLVNILVFLSVDKNIASIIGAIVAFFYMALVGFTPGVVRSGAMVVIVLISGVFLYRTDGFTNLFYVFLLLLFNNPYSICSTGLQLSFLCSFGILLTQPIVEDIEMYFSARFSVSGFLLQRLTRLCIYVCSSVILTFVATVISFPVMFLGYDTVSYISPIINLLAVPLFNLALKFTLAAYIIAPISSVLGGYIALPAGYLYDWITKFANFIKDADIGVMSVRTPYMIIPVICALVIVGLLIFVSRRQLVALALSSLVFCVSIFACGVVNKIQFSDKIIIDYGCDNTEYAYISTEEANVYFDLGGYRAFSDAVYESGKISLDNYVFTVLNNSAVNRFDNFSCKANVKTLYLPIPSGDAEVAIVEKIKILANERNCDIIIFNEDLSLSINEKVNVSVIGPSDSFNEKSIYIKTTDKKYNLLGRKYNNASNCDLVILPKNFKGDINLINANSIYGWAETSNNKMFDGLYNSRLRIEFDFSESEQSIYES